LTTVFELVTTLGVVLALYILALLIFQGAIGLLRRARRRRRDEPQ
jgi:hypothetical protein